MGHQDGCSTAIYNFTHFLFAFLLESTIAHRQHLVQDQDVWLYQRCDSEGQPGLHAGGQLLEGPVLKILQFREINDLVIHFIHEFSGVAQHGTAKIRIFPDCQVSVKAAG